MNLDSFTIIDRFTDEDIEKIVASELPEWKKACDSQEAGGVILHQAAFGHSAKELLLQAVAIKYAGRKGKEVRIIAG